MKKIGIILRTTVLLSLLLISISISACDTTKWHAKDYGGPPSWENDFGRPGGYSGEEPWR